MNQKGGFISTFDPDADIRDFLSQLEGTAQSCRKRDIKEDHIRNALDAQGKPFQKRCEAYLQEKMKRMQKDRLMMAKIYEDILRIVSSMQ